MADQNFFPGFEGDDEPPQQQTPAKPAAAPAKPAFDPFAGVPVNTAAPSAPPPAGKPATGRTSRVPAAPAAPPPPADADADIKPGARKDLWKCPHCGAGNKPDRTTCRACGKSPDEPVVVPLWKNNLVRAGVLAVIGLLVIWALWPTDLSLREPVPGAIDRKARIGGRGIASIELGSGLRLEGERQIAVCGRIAGLGSGPGGTVLVALALGPAAADENVTATPADGSFTVDGVVLACDFSDAVKLQVGRILSLTGVVGVLVKDGRVVHEPAGILPVAVGEYRQSE